MANQQPTHRAYTVIKREGQDDYWLNIGAAFMHQDGDGFNIVLQALPIDGKIVLRLPKSTDESQQNNGGQQSSEPKPRQNAARPQRSRS